VARAPTSADLSSLALFGAIPLGGLELFCRKAHVVELDAGVEVFHEGDEARDMYVVADGAVAVSKDRAGVETELVVLGPGEFFGEMSFVDMQARAGTVRTTTPTTLWRWAYPTLRDIYQDDPRSYLLLVMNIARELSRRLRRADERLVQLT
jgi:CRP-like cAMP-binding protein